MGIMIFAGLKPLCPTESEPVNGTSIANCTEYFYSMAMEFGLHGPQKHISGLLASLSMIGLSIGLLFAGCLSDRFGRKVVQLAAIAVSIISVIALSLSPDWKAFGGALFVLSAVTGSLFSVQTNWDIETFLSKV